MLNGKCPSLQILQLISRKFLLWTKYCCKSIVISDPGEFPTIDKLAKLFDLEIRLRASLSTRHTFALQDSDALIQMKLVFPCHQAVVT